MDSFTARQAEVLRGVTRANGVAGTCKPAAQAVITT
jgi:hypothetical protein